MQTTLPRVAAMHDLSGFGKCALTVALPVISACGIEVCPLPTAVLSTSTNYDGFTLYDFTPHIEEYVSHWQKMGLHFDALYSGFLGSVEQINMVGNFAKRFNLNLVVIDPVMADDGVVYKTCSPEMCNGMKKLAQIAHVMTPNYTEACVLADEEYRPDNVTIDDSKRIAKKIIDLGAKSVVITGIERDNQLVNCVLDEEGYTEHTTPLLPYRLHGTGDLFASMLTGALMTGHSLHQAVDSAANFVYYTMKMSRSLNREIGRVYFEPYLNLISNGIFTL